MWHQSLCDKLQKYGLDWEVPNTVCDRRDEISRCLTQSAKAIKTDAETELHCSPHTDPFCSQRGGSRETALGRSSTAAPWEWCFSPEMAHVGAMSWWAAQKASITTNGFSAKLHRSHNSAFGAKMSLLDEINIASVISASCVIIPALQEWPKSQGKLMGQIKDNRKCIWSSTLILDTAFVFSLSELILNMPHYDGLLSHSEVIHIFHEQLGE